MTDEERKAKRRERNRRYHWANREKILARQRAKSREYYLANREVILAKQRVREGSDPEKYRLMKQKSTARYRATLSPAKKAEQIKRYRLKKMYGLTLEQYNKLYEAQGGLCGICHVRLDKGVRGATVDHCHDTGKIRGLLCASCNNMLGHGRDNPTRLANAIEYLKRSTLDKHERERLAFKLAAKWLQAREQGQMPLLVN